MGKLKRTNAMTNKRQTCPCVTLTKVKKDRSVFKQRGSTRSKIFRTRCVWIILYVSLHDDDVVSVR